MGLIIGLVWVCAIIAGNFWLWRYEGQAGEPSRSPVMWPAGMTFQPPAGKDTLVVLLHPHCPCSRATVDELDRIMAQCQGRLQAFALMSTPAGLSVGEEATGLERSVAAIPGVTVIHDTHGKLANLFGATTSGHVCLYSVDGQLLFSGGITGSRGHSGDNTGQWAVVNLVTHARRTQPASTPVYGCPLFGPTCQASQERGDACPQ